MVSKPIILFFVFPLLIFAQNDSLPAFITSTIVVTADRSENTISNSTSSISVIESKELNAIPGRSYFDAVRSAGGIFTMYTGSTYSNPVVSPRGYYGGGEADYALMMINGIPLNNLASGLAEWNLLPLEYIEKIEILKGGSSVLYGDAAMGGMINLFTPGSLKENIKINLSAGSHNYYKGYVSKSGLFAGNSYSLYFAPESSEGFRNHSFSKRIQFGGAADFLLSSEDKLSIASYNMISDEDSPGPLSGEELVLNRNISSVYYSEDGNKKSILNITGNYDRSISTVSEVGVNVLYKYNKYDLTRTTTNASLIIEPSDFSVIGVYDTSFYGDTKLRQVSDNELFLGLKYVSNFKNLKIVAGSDLSASNFKSKHFDFFSGFEEDYKNRFLAYKTLSTEGRNARRNYSFYINSELSLLNPMKFVFGLRYDLIETNLHNIIPDTSIKTSTDAFSPKAGLNICLAQSKIYSGNLYINYNRSFKAPASDQLTNLSQLNSLIFITTPDGYVPVPFRASPFSNSRLKPQIADNFEAGMYQKFLLSEIFYIDLSIAAYTTLIKDEIDFDLNTFRYENINKTRHTGFEGSIKLISGNWDIFLNHSIRRVKFSYGELTGHNLKGIPQFVSSFGLLFNDVSGLTLGVVFSGTGRIFLDDENTKSISGYRSTDLKLGYDYGIISLGIICSNIFDERFNYNGFLLSGKEFYYPAGGRMLTGELKAEF